MKHSTESKASALKTQAEALMAMARAQESGIVTYYSGRSTAELVAHAKRCLRAAKSR